MGSDRTSDLGKACCNESGKVELDAENVLITPGARSPTGGLAPEASQSFCGCCLLGDVAVEDEPVPTTVVSDVLLCLVL